MSDYFLLNYMILVAPFKQDQCANTIQAYWHFVFGKGLLRKTRICSMHRDYRKLWFPVNQKLVALQRPVEPEEKSQKPCFWVLRQITWRLIRTDKQLKQKKPKLQIFIPSSNMAMECCFACPTHNTAFQMVKFRFFSSVRYICTSPQPHLIKYLLKHDTSSTNYFFNMNTSQRRNCQIKMTPQNYP